MSDADGIEPGDFVQLVPRERPYRDDAGWWWRVLMVDEYDGLHVVYDAHARSGSWNPHRSSVCQDKVLDHRKADEA